MSKHEHLDKSLDDNFSNLNWLPWVGKDYAKLKKRLLIVGESHYAWGANDEEYSHRFHEANANKDFTRDCIYEACIERVHWTNNTYDNLHRTLLRTNNFQYNILWENVCFYNFIPRLMDYRVREQHQWADFYSSWETFMKIVEILNPTECVFIGVNASNSFNLAMDALRIGHSKVKWHKKINGTYPRTASVQLKNEELKISFIKHSSQMFSWSIWNVFLQSQGNSTFQFLQNKVNGIPEIEELIEIKDDLRGLPVHLNHKPIIAINYRTYTEESQNDARFLSIGRAQYDNTSSSIKLWRSKDGKWSRQSEEIPIYRVTDFTLMLASTIERISNNTLSEEFTTEIVAEEDLAFLKDEILQNKEPIVTSLKKLRSILNRIDLDNI